MLKPVHQRFKEKAWEKSNLNWMSYADLSLRLPELLLMRVDKMSMGESRSEEHTSELQSPCTI